MISPAACWHFEEAVSSGSLPATWRISEPKPFERCTIYSCIQCPFSGNQAEANAHSKSNAHSFFKNITGHGVYCTKCDDLIYPANVIQLVANRSSDEDVEDDQATQSKRGCKRQGLRGMYNLGQTCYLNSMIQALIHNSLLASFFLGNGHPNYSCELDDCVACALTDAFEASWTGEEAEPFAPTKMLISSWRNAVIEVGDQQHDSHEFYLGLLDKLHTRIHVGNDEHCKCFVHRVFYGSLRDTLICGSCKHNKTTRNPICDLALDIPSLALMNGSVRPKPILDLTTCLKNFVAPEQLEGRIGIKESAAYACSNCGAEGKVTKKLEIKRLPPILCIQLKRFRRTKDEAKKIEDHVAFPLSIDMAPYTTRAQNQLMYDLESVVVHQSEAGKGEIEKGHYFTYSQRGHQWFLFNDDQVSVASMDDVLDAQAYVLFYRMRTVIRPDTDHL